MDLKHPPSPSRSQDRIPSYEESIAQHAQQYTRPAITSTLSSQIAASRTARIDALIVDAVLPRLHAQVEAGLTRTTTVLLPRDSAAATADAPSPSSSSSSYFFSGSTSASDTAADAVIASDATVQDLLSTDQNVTLLQLRGATHTAAFWAQPGADSALAGALRARLRAEGHRIAGDPDSSPLIPSPSLASPPLPHPPPPSSSSSASPSSPATTPTASASASATTVTTPPPAVNGNNSKKRGFWRRMADSAADKTGDGVGVLHRPRAPQQGLGAGEVKIDVEVRDVAIRVCTELGLYESRTGTAVVVRVEIGGVEWTSGGGGALKN